MTVATDPDLHELPKTDPESSNGRIQPPNPRVRTAVAVLVTKFPRIAETSILREINELERQGQPVLLIPLMREHGPVTHEEAKPWIGRALYMPLLSPSIVAANIVRLVREPRRYLTLLLRLMAGTAMRPGILVRTVALFPKSVYLAGVLPGMGIRHVHAHFAVHPTTMAFIVSSLTDIPYSFTMHGPDVFVHRLLMREKIAKATFVRAVSTFVKAFITGLYPEESEGKIEVVHVGVDPELYSAGPPSPPRPSGRIQVLSVAALTAAKGFPFLVDACASLMQEGIDLECRIVGDGPQKPLIRERIAQHGLGERIRLVGALPQHVVARLMGEADLFVLPSVIAWNGQMDGIPVSLMEAMAAGKPVVASAISGIPELVQHGSSGVLVDSTHPERIAAAVRGLIEDPDLRTSMGRIGQERVRADFHVRQTSEKLIELFERHDEPERTAFDEIRTINWGELNTCALGLRRLRERRDSLVAELTVTDGITWRDVVVKRQRGRSGESRSATERARHEVRTMRQLREKMHTLSGDASEAITYTVPKILTFDDRNAALVMERARGRSLESMIRSSRYRSLGRHLLAPVRRAGRWLRVLQEAIPAGDDGRHVLTALVVLATRDLELAAAADRVLRRHHDAILDTLRTLEARVAAGPLPAASHHGDYWPGNIFIGDRQVQVIDFEGYREGLQLEDVAYFLIHFGMYFDYPLFRRYLPRLENAFLDGFSGGRVDPDALRLMKIAKTLQVLARGGVAAKRGIRARWRRRRLRKLILENIR